MSAAAIADRVCRNCGAPIPPGARRRLFCGVTCNNRFHSRAQSGRAVGQVAATKPGLENRGAELDVPGRPAGAVAPAMRACLNCGGRFRSQGWGHRLCRLCTASSTAISGRGAPLDTVRGRKAGAAGGGGVLKICADCLGEHREAGIRCGGCARDQESGIRDQVTGIRGGGA